MADYAQRYAQFVDSRQPPICLRIAMEDFFQPDLPEEYKKAYGQYLHKRIRPLAEQLILAEDLDKLEVLDREQWLTPALVEEFCHLASEKHKAAALVWLLQKKQKLGAFGREEFSL